MDLRSFGVEAAAPDVLPWFTGSDLLRNEGLQTAAARLRFTDGKLWFEGVAANAYFASVAVDFLRGRFMIVSN